MAKETKKDAAPPAAAAEENAEDAELKKNLDLMVERISDPDPGRRPLFLHAIAQRSDLGSQASKSWRSRA